MNRADHFCQGGQLPPNTDLKEAVMKRRNQDEEETHGIPSSGQSPVRRTHRLRRQQHREAPGRRPDTIRLKEVNVETSQYTFTLREGVKFHNGDEVTAEDVVYSISRCADTTDGTPLVEAFSVIQSVEAVDARTVAITIAEPSNEFISYMTTAILPADYDQQDTAPVGTGPFKFVSRAAQDNIVLERFDEYWGTPA